MSGVICVLRVVCIFYANIQSKYLHSCVLEGLNCCNILRMLHAEKEYVDIKWAIFVFIFIIFFVFLFFLAQ